MTDDQNIFDQISALATTGGPTSALSLFSDESQDGIALPKPFTNRILLLEGIRVAGTTHVEGIDELVSDLPIGTELTLKRDPLNRHDTWCIEAHTPSGKRIGYLPCDRNEIIARLMDGGKRCLAVVVDKQVMSGWNKIGIEVYLDD